MAKRNAGIAYAAMMMPEVHPSNRVPSRTAFRMPRGIEMRYASSVDQSPKVMDTGIFSITRSVTSIDRK